MAEQFTIDCKQPAADKILDVAEFEKFLQDTIKVEGLKGNFNGLVEVVREGDAVKITSQADHNSGYMKYLYVVPW